MYKLFLFAFALFLSISVFAQSTISYQKVSEQFLQNLKDKRNTDKQVKIFAESSWQDIDKQLQTDAQKKAFWMNVYNGFIQQILKDNPSLFDDRGAFFKKEQVNIAGEMLSFDDIEHGIIRKSRCKLSWGYLRKPFRPKWERELRVEDIDWRIHFALNCGAKSCPPVAIYSPENLDQQLDFMTKKYLKEKTTYNAETKTATTTSLISWFRGDFGGKSGAREILKNYKITPEEPDDLEFANYDWTLLLDNYRELPKF